jgi:hypothetical protein
VSASVRITRPCPSAKVGPSRGRPAGSSRRLEPAPGAEPNDRVLVFLEQVQSTELGSGCGRRPVDDQLYRRCHLGLGGELAREADEPLDGQLLGGEAVECDLKAGLLRLKLRV